MIRIIHWLLSLPIVFEWQQRLCNNYGIIRTTFPQYLAVKGKDILDVGCSTGTCAASLISMRDNRYVGIDIDPRYVIRASQLHSDGQFLHMDAQALTFPEESFDVILFVGALHHMSGDIIERCFRQLERVLRPNGVIICAEPLFSDRKLSTWLLRNDRGEFIRDLPGYRALFTKWDIVEERRFTIAVHDFCGFVLKRRDARSLPVRERLAA
jgi:ubiquinone/menaquinone biosynthesis C-methylase UbiE